LAYMLRTPRPVCIFGDSSIGFTAGSGIDGAGEVDLRSDGDELNDERRLCAITGGFIGNDKEVGVPGVDGMGDASDDVSLTNCGRRSGGAGLFEDVLRDGRSILDILPCWARVNCPSFVLRV